jgi:1-acyl-sn-glycerol-3-phosphate acyltransferase
VKMLVQPRPFKYFGWFLRRIGGIQSTRLEDRGGGAVARIAKELNVFDKFLFLISPKGTISKGEWRSGYYHIARELKIPLMIGAIDYEKKSGYVSQHISSTFDEPDVRAYLLDQLSNVVPLYPESEIVKVRPHNPNKCSVVDRRHLLKCCIAYGLMYLVWCRMM